MSIKIMSIIWEHGPANQTERFVLLALADYANDDGECWPSLEGVARKTCIADRSVRRIMRRLEDAGWLETNIGGGRKNCNLYRVKTRNRVPSEPRSPRNHAPKNPDPVSPRTLCPPDPESLNPDPVAAPAIGGMIKKGADAVMQHGPTQRALKAAQSAAEQRAGSRAAYSAFENADAQISPKALARLRGRVAQRIDAAGAPAIPGPLGHPLISSFFGLADLM